MKRTLPILLIIFSALLVHAQVDSLHLAKTDSITASLNHKDDSLNQKLKNLQDLKLKVPFTNNADSVNRVVNGKLQMPNRLENKLKHKADSINPQREIDQYNQKVVVLQKHSTHHIDSCD